MIFSNISAIGEVQSPMVCLSSCEICMEDVYKQVPVRYQAVLVNQTLLATEFKWGQVSTLKILSFYIYVFGCERKLDNQISELLLRFFTFYFIYKHQVNPFTVN